MEDVRTHEGFGRRARQSALALIAAVLALAWSPLAAPAPAAPAQAAPPALTVDVSANPNPGQAGVRIRAWVEGPELGYVGGCPSVESPDPANPLPAGRVFFFDETNGFRELGDAVLTDHLYTCEPLGPFAATSAPRARADLVVDFSEHDVGETHRIVATFVPDSIHAQTDGHYDQTISYIGVPTTLTVTGSPNPGQNNVELTARVEGEVFGLGCTEIPIAGRVQFFDTTHGLVEIGDAATSGFTYDCEVVGPGFARVRATASASILRDFAELGTTYEITAQFTPDDLNAYDPSVDSYSQQVAANPQPTSVVVTADPNPGRVGVAITATVTGFSSGQPFGTFGPCPLPRPSPTGIAYFIDRATGQELGSVDVVPQPWSCDEILGSFFTRSAARSTATITHDFPVEARGSARTVDTYFVPANDLRFGPSQGSYSQYVRRATQTTVTASPNPGRRGVVMSATVRAGLGQADNFFICGDHHSDLTGVVEFVDDVTGRTLGDAPLGASTVACEEIGDELLRYIVASASFTFDFPAEYVGSTHRISAYYVSADEDRYASSEGSYDQAIRYLGRPTVSSVEPGAEAGTVLATVSADTGQRVEECSQVNPDPGQTPEGAVSFVDATDGRDLGSVPVGNPRLVCVQDTGGLLAVHGQVSAQITVPGAPNQLGQTHRIVGTFVPEDEDVFAPSADDAQVVLAGHALTLASNNNPSALREAVRFSAQWNQCVPDATLGRARQAGVLRITDTTTGKALGSKSVARKACANALPPIVLSVSTSALAAGSHHIVATFTPTRAPAPLATAELDQFVDGLSARITTATGSTITRSTGKPVSGIAKDPAGPGVGAVLLYYRNVTTGAGGVLGTTCPACGPGARLVDWTAAVAHLPAGTYDFIAQAVDVDEHFSEASNVVRIRLT